MNNIFITTALLTVSACATYAPPARIGALDDGSSLAVGTHELELAGFIGGPRYAYGFAENWAVQTGIETDFATNVMGYVGLQPTLNIGSRFWIAFPFGIAGGWGGEKSTYPDFDKNNISDSIAPQSPTKTTAVGATLGFRGFESVSGYFSARYQYATARDLPPTFWQNYALGCRIGFAPHWAILVEGNYFHYRNSSDVQDIPLVSAAISYRFLPE